MEGDPLGEGEQKISGPGSLHGDQGALPEPCDRPLQGVGLSPDLGIGGKGSVVAVGEGGGGGIDPEGAVGTSEEELGAIGGDGLDPRGAALEELYRVVGAVHHYCLCLLTLRGLCPAKEKGNQERQRITRLCPPNRADYFLAILPD